MEHFSGMQGNGLSRTTRIKILLLEFSVLPNSEDVMFIIQSILKHDVLVNGLLLA
jgi:hypothetical protein